MRIWPPYNDLEIEGRALAAAARATPFGAMMFVRPCTETVPEDFVTQANLWGDMPLVQHRTVVGAGRFVGREPRRRFVVVNDHCDKLLTTNVPGAIGFNPYAMLFDHGRTLTRSCGLVRRLRRLKH